MAKLVAFDTVYLAPVTIGGEVFELIVDTGSSDLWVVQKNFTCISSSGTVLLVNLP